VSSGSPRLAYILPSPRGPRLILAALPSPTPPPLSPSRVHRRRWRTGINTSECLLPKWHHESATTAACPFRIATPISSQATAAYYHLKYGRTHGIDATQRARRFGEACRNDQRHPYQSPKDRQDPLSGYYRQGRSSCMG
jgi:hypothetical protein